MKLYEIEQAILECIDEETGEIIDVSKFDALHLDRQTKIDNIISLYKHLNYEAEAIKQEEKALAERRKQKEANAENIKAWLSEKIMGEVFETARNKISWRSSESVNIIDAELIPHDYCKVVQTLTPVKDDIRKAIKAGILVPGATLESKANIQIK